MERIYRLANTPRGATLAGTIMSAVVAVSVFGFGAPGWIIVPVIYVGCTLHAELSLRADRHIDQRPH